MYRLDGGLCYDAALRLFCYRVCIIKLMFLFLCYRTDNFMSDFVKAICDLDDDLRPLSERVNDAGFDEAAWLAQATEDARAEGFDNPREVAVSCLDVLRKRPMKTIPLSEFLSKYRSE